MKKIIVTAALLIAAISTYGQEGYTEIVVDGQPAWMTPTGEIVYDRPAGVKSSSSSSYDAYQAVVSGTSSNTQGATTTYTSGSYETDGSGRYMIQSGDTLYSIAKHFGTSVADLKSLNGLDSNLIKIGFWLKTR